MTGTGAGPPPITVVLVDGPPDRASGLAAAGMRVLAAGAGPGAVDAVVRAGPEVVVVDLDDGRDALAVIALVADALPGVAVLAVSGSAEHANVLAAVRAGATGYLTTTGVGGVVDAVERLAGGESVFSPGLAAVVLEARSGPDAARLTDRELDVLRLVGEGLTARQIATRLVLSPRTVENHVQHLLRKLNLTTRAALIRYAIERGLA